MKIYDESIAPLWLEILLKNPELSVMEEDRVRMFLKNLEFPAELIEEYLKRRPEKEGEI
jgi:hypothetical protein